MDLINRQAAIDIERNATVDTNPSHFEAHQKFMQFMNDAEISSFGRWQWSNGFNTALTAVGIDLKKLPSAQPEPSQVARDIATIIENEKDMRVIAAQPEIIRCKDCKHYKITDNRAFGFPVKRCKWTGFEDVDDDDFCSRAERRTDDKR